MESGLEQQETDRGESVAKFKAIADSLTIRDSSQFQNQEIDYSTKPWRKTLAERIKKGHGDIVVLIQLGAGARSDGIVSPSHLDPENLEAWLAYRLPNRIYGSTWAPIMGKVEERDLKHEFASLPKLKFGEFIRLVPVLREEKEVSEKGWLLDVMRCVDKLSKKEFTLDEIYNFENELSLLHPENKHIKDKIRQQLQFLRNKGYSKKIEDIISSQLPSE